jgi:hypothetical protein
MNTNPETYNKTNALQKRDANELIELILKDYPDKYV